MPQNSFNKFVSLLSPLSCALSFRTFIYCGFLSEISVIVVFLFAICNMLFVIFKCNINLNIYVKCYGHRVAVYFHAPRGIVL